MFERRERFQSDEEYRRNAAGKQGTTLAKWQREAETWFDGSVESVDRRLAMCQRLLGTAQEKVAHTGLASDNGNSLAMLGALERSRAALTELRHDLITGSTWREEPVRRINPKREAAVLAALSSEDRRYVELTARSLVSMNADVESDELVTRARYMAARDTSSFHDVRANRVIDALAVRVSQQARQRPQVRKASLPAAVSDFPAELMYF